MTFANTETDKFFDETLKVEIDWIFEEDSNGLSFLFNDFDDPTSFNMYLIELFCNAKKEISNNLLLLTNRENRFDYLNALWVRCIRNDNEVLTLYEEFLEGGILYNGFLNRPLEYQYGFVIEDRIIKISTPELELPIVKTDFDVKEFYAFQLEKTEQLTKFVFELCESLNIDVKTNFESLVNFFKRKDHETHPNVAFSIENENLVRFDNAAQKYLLLKELEIIDFLDEKYPLTSSAKKGLLLAYITDTRTGKPFENILSAVFNKNTESEHHPIKERNEIKVNRILAEIGIERKTTIAAIKKK